jgi:ribosome-binding protein aMBF1 (putative translation factor)
MKTFKQFKVESMKRSGVKKEMLRDDLEFQIIEAMIKTRLKRELTQKELAEKIGIAQSALARFESGKTNPTLSFIQKITSGLGLKIILK